ncbi:hypothetical protein MTO96_006845 [Rhipicephalus appendiculatus]
MTECGSSVSPGRQGDRGIPPSLAGTPTTMQDCKHPRSSAGMTAVTVRKVAGTALRLAVMHRYETQRETLQSNPWLAALDGQTMRGSGAHDVSTGGLTYNVVLPVPPDFTFPQEVHPNARHIFKNPSALYGDEVTPLISDQIGHEKGRKPFAMNLFELDHKGAFDNISPPAS